MERRDRGQIRPEYLFLIVVAMAMAIAVAVFKSSKDSESLEDWFRSCTLRGGVVQEPIDGLYLCVTKSGTIIDRREER